MKNYKALAEEIYKRKSVRVYSELPIQLLEGDADIMRLFDIRPLVPDIKIQVRILTEKTEVKNKRSNYCIAFYSEEKPLYLENIGFIGQQIDLELQSRSVGTCWWGMKKPKKDYKSIDGLDCVITMTAGYPKHSETRDYPHGFQRKPAADILLGNSEPDSCIEAVRLAPSAVNLQPWLVQKTGNRYNFYLRPPKGMIEKIIGDMRRIDMGIALAHLFVQAKADGAEPSFDFTGEDSGNNRFTAAVII